MTEAPSGWDPRWVTGALLAVVAGLSVALALALPRAWSVDGLVEENLALKVRLESMEAKMAEVDRILLRVRLYEAQLESLGEPDGGAGPAAVSRHIAQNPEPVKNRVLRNAEGRASRPLAPGRSSRPAVGWARGIEARADRLMDTFGAVEADLSSVVEELESVEALDRALPSAWPAAGFLTSKYGWRRDPLGYGWKHHAGIDIGGQVGDPVWSAEAGTVRYAGPRGAFGQMVTVDHGFGVTTNYAHCARILVRQGQRVRRGQQLALVGNTGRSTGPHLHFEVRLDGNAVDPLTYLPARRGWVAPWRRDSGD